MPAPEELHADHVLSAPAVGFESAQSAMEGANGAEVETDMIARGLANPVHDESAGVEQASVGDRPFEPVVPPVREHGPIVIESSHQATDSERALDASEGSAGNAQESTRSSPVPSVPRDAPAEDRAPRSAPPSAVRSIERYTVFQEFASGGMATVHLGRLCGAAGFSRVVAIKRLHPHLLNDPEFCEMFVTEARLTARVRHPNVVAILDVLADEHEIALVMEFVRGESLVALLRAAAKRGETMPVGVAAGIMVGVLQGLHAAHQARDERGQPLSIVHRDVSPHNVLIGADGIARVFDFGIAKAALVTQDTDPGLLKGKASYMAPEQIRGTALTPAVDIFASGVVFWELLTGRKLFGGRDNAERLYKVLGGGYPRPSQFRPDVPAALDDIVMRAMARDPAERFSTALDFAEAVERATLPASPRSIGLWVASRAAEVLAVQTELVCAVETQPAETDALPVTRIPEDALSSLPPPTAMAKIGGSPQGRRRHPWLLALSGVVVGALVVAAVSRVMSSAPWAPSNVGPASSGMGSSATPPRPRPSARRWIAAASRTSAQNKQSMSLPSASSSAQVPPPWEPHPHRSRSRAAKPRPRREDPRGFRPTEL
ncbi:serine/threonine-protein kinase [Myxococcota bacterium]